MKFDLDLSMEEDGLLKLTLVDKSTGTLTSFENNSYSTLISKCYSHFLKEIKGEARPLGTKGLMRYPSGPPI